MQRGNFDTICPNCKCSRMGYIAIPPSPVPNLIHTNQIPSPSDTHFINDVLARIRLDLLQIDRDINLIQSILNQLLRNREELREFGHAHEVLLSPIRHLPHEILSYTFLLSIPNINETRAQELKRAVMLPAQVCRHWRNVALSTPRLWSQIPIDLKERNSEEEAAFAHRWLARSSGCPLSISLSQFMTFDNQTSVAPFDAVVAQSDRWEHLDLTISHRLLDVFRSAKSHFSRLQTLSIKGNITTGEMLHAFAIAPQLHSLTIGHNIFPTGLRVPWSQLTYCDMHPYQLSIDHCFEVLQLAPNLEEYHLHLYCPGPYKSRSPIRHERLRRLAIQASTELGPFFDKLTLPALRTFSHSEPGYRYRWSQPQFLSFLSRSRCALQSFCVNFSSAHLSDENLAQILELAPSLTTLELRNQCARNTLTNTILAQLTPTAQELQRLLPNLTTFVLDFYDELDGEAFADMIESRRRLEAHDVSLLGSVALRDCRRSSWIESSILSRLQKCRDEGLDIYWSVRKGCKELRFPL